MRSETRTRTCLARCSFANRTSCLQRDGKVSGAYIPHGISYLASWLRQNNGQSFFKALNFFVSLALKLDNRIHEVKESEGSLTRNSEHVTQRFNSWRASMHLLLQEEPRALYLVTTPEDERLGLPSRALIFKPSPNKSSSRITVEFLSRNEVDITNLVRLTNRSVHGCLGILSVANGKLRICWLVMAMLLMISG